MKANAVFNCIYCVVYMFYPMNSCLEYVGGTFCSSIYNTQFAQYFKIVVLTYFGETIKMCANITYIMMTLNRYMLIGKEQAPWLVAIAKLEFSWVIRGSFLLSALINIGHGFEYTIISSAYSPYTSNHFHILLYQYNRFDSKAYISQYPSVNTDTYSFVCSVIYFTINVVVFFFINTLIEVQILNRMRKELGEKRKRLARMNVHRFATPTNNTNEIGEAEDSKKERRVIIMVVLNSILNFILRFPDFLLFLENSRISSSLNNVNNTFPGFSNLLLDISYLAYILTFSTNVLIFYNFNNKFKEAFIAYFKREKKQTT
jgi:hypothetical protein